ncbi:MAG: oxygen-dependent coproporphyrinogen oxidase [Bacteroidetes bacterium]|nr:oxygen-dependent coproporphyrinogen oxidase [Bacteroidota bacterium]
MEVNKFTISEWLKKLQSQICNALENADELSKFISEEWERDEGGGGKTNIISNGNVIEKGGVLYSAVYGKTPDFLKTEKQHTIIGAETSDTEFYATGISIVIHPKSPMVPIIHMNVRYFEMSNGTKWLGGGIDLTPHYINTKDASFFHTELKKVCDKHNLNYYQKFKNWADDYFFIKHRSETRGIGGIFFDRLTSDETMTFSQNLNFWKDIGSAFAPIYVELIQRNKQKHYTEAQKQWQLLRRGRYVEFNLIYDKGTKFGLETNGRVESILMSLPSNASWQYNFQPKAASEEFHTLSLLKKGINWL